MFSQKLNDSTLVVISEFLCISNLFTKQDK